MKKNPYFKTSVVLLSIIILWTFSSKAADWKQVQKMKLDYITLVAQHAMDQQKRNELPTVPIPFPSSITDSPKMKILSKSPRELKLQLTGIQNEPKKPVDNVIRFTLPKPVDMLSKGSGIAVLVQADPNSSKEVRLGIRLIAQGGKKTADIIPFIPVLDTWGEAKHEIYFDWSFINYKDVHDAIDVLKQVESIEILSAAFLRAPERGPSKTPQSATVTISNMRLVDYLKGSYDPARHSWKEGVEPDLTLQQRCQEVTGVVASFGGKEGIKSAIESLDHVARTQCWDGSFLDGRRGASTVVSGEYTFGFAIYGYLTGYLALEKAKVPELNERITIGPNTMTRHDFYKRMFYRAAMARERVCGPTKYRDDIIGGNTLITGANRVLGYAIGMRMVADIFPEGDKRKEIMSKYNEIMDEIQDAQGKFSGGFPILAEGDRYNGAGIHYDAGYTRTHMDWLIIAVQRTGDPRFIEMLRRYQDVFNAVMNSKGTGLLTLLSERGHSDNTMGSVELVIPDATAQVGMKYNLPLIAQWGYNNGMAEWLVWNEKSSNFWSSKSKEHGYTLGAHSARLLDDFVAEPEPRDIGYLFPRQFPIWSTTLYNKNSQPVRTSHVYIKPDGTMENDFKIEIGLYPETVGIPVSINSPKGTVIATAIKLEGWPKLLPENADLTVTINGELRQNINPGKPFNISLDGKSIIMITGPVIQLPNEANNEKVNFKAIFTLEPQGAKKQLPVTLILNRGAVNYNHQFIDLAKN
jgi:hypothetical protein